LYKVFLDSLNLSEDRYPKTIIQLSIHFYLPTAGWSI